MGMMAKMRSLAPWFILGVGGLFVLFMILSDSKIGDMISQRSNAIGEVNGEEITYQEYSQLVEQYRQLQVQQTGQELAENQMEFLRDNVWNQIVNQRLIEEKINEFGIVVTDDEVRDALLGPNPPESVKQYFIDSTGSFNRQAYEAAIYNPQNKQAVLQLEQQVRAQMLQTKLQNQINAVALVSEEEIKQEYIDQNIKMNAEYVQVGWSTIPDSLAAVTDDEIQEYYDEHKKDYEQKEQRKIKYVLFRRQASAGDSAGIRNNLEAIIEKLKTDTSTFKTYVEIYSQQPYSKDTLQLTQIQRGAQDEIAIADEGAIVGPVLTSDGYVVYRVVDKFRADEQVVRASHILIPANPDNPEDNTKAMEIYNKATSGGDFAALAKEFSEDPGSGENGGDLGWFGKGQMVPEFERAAFSGRIGEILRPVKSQFGWHIIKVTGKDRNNYVLEKIVSKIEPSATTVDGIYEDAGDFSYLAERDGFEEVASQLDYDVVETTFFEEDTRSVPGLGVNRALAVFTFENSVGDVSQVFRVPAGFAVAMVSEIKPKGYKPLEDVKAQLERTLVQERKKEKALEIAKEIRQSITADDLEAAKNIYSKAKVAAVQNFAPSGNIPTLGNDHAFALVAYKTDLNTLSDAFLGTRGAYIVKVTKRDEFDSTAYSLERSTIRDRLLNQKKNRVFSQWLQEIRDEADIEDNRYMFYQ